MGIDIHAFNFIKIQAACYPLGDVLTIGRHSLSLKPEKIEKYLNSVFESTGYCEPLLSALGAKSVSSLDCSDYEDATYVVDLNKTVNLGFQFDTVIDSGSLEHIFDVAAAFRNIINLTKVGGRIIHFLPVNNLNGHGFWQFSSDLLYSIYSENNGFETTEVYYASSLNESHWYKVPKAKPGVRVEIVSLEPIILLTVTRKVRNVESISVMQPFYAVAWNGNDAPLVRLPEKLGSRIKTSMKRLVERHSRLSNFLRNCHLIFGLITGSSHYSINSTFFQKIEVDQVLQEHGR